MANQVIKDTFLNVYNDDYRDSDNFYKILFNNGRSLQQRELNQMQSIINNDVHEVGDFLFAPGSASTGGAPSIISDAFFLKLDPANPLPDSPTSIEGEIFQEAISGILIKIIKVAVAADGDPNTIYFTYVDANGEVSTTDEPVSLTPGRLLTGQTSATEIRAQQTDTSINPALGKGCLFTVNEGKFHIDGHFVFSPQQTLILSKYTNVPTTVVGFVVTEDIVTVNDDENLYDNSGANLNISAPGADRYRIRLTLSEESDADADAYFIKISEISDGKISITRGTKGNGALGQIAKILAIRTHEESGNYTTQQPTVDFKTSPLDADAFELHIGEGKAYVEGHRVHIRNTIKTIESKPRTTKSVQNAASTAAYGNYVVVSTLKGTPDISTFEKVNLSTSLTDASASVVGSARVRAIEAFGSNYKVYLFEVKMNSGTNFSAVRSLGDGDGTSSTFLGVAKLNAGAAVLNDLQNNNLFFPLARSRPKTLTDVLLTKQIIITGYSSNGSGDVTIPVTSGHVFDDASSWIITRNDTGVVVSPTITVSGDALTADLSGLPNSTAITVLSYQQKSVGVVAQKTLTTRTQTISGITSSVRLKDLDRADVFELTSVVDVDSGDTVTGRYTIDSGQRDNFYDVGSIELKTGRGAPTGDITVTYKYFEHGAGDFFAVNSYNGQVAYEKIPSHRQTNGETIELRDVLDFRPRRSNNGSNFSSTGSQVFTIPANSDLINFDVEYYVGVRGKIFIHRDGYAGIDYGEPGFNPQFKDLGPGAMEIANVELYPYWLNDDDMKLKYIDNKRYTMRDIAGIEDRVDELEELTSLTMLELQTQNIDVFDSAGLNRFKAGITADNFTDHSQSATNDLQYAASIDPIRNELRANHEVNAIELVFDSDASTNVKLSGDYVTLNYTSTVYKQQTGASRPVSVNAHPHPRMVGSVVMSPSTDNWIDTKTLPKKIIRGDDKVSVKGSSSLFGSHNLNWSGYKKLDLENYKAGDVLSSTVVGTDKSTAVTRAAAYGKDGVSTTTTTTKKRNYTLSKASVLKESLGDFVRSRTSIPYMRSRFVSFKVTGLRPNTQHFVFFDDARMASWCNMSSGTSNFAAMATLPRTSPLLAAGTIYKKATQYPAKLGGPTSSVTTDANGACSGYMLIPNTDDIRFETGRKTFRITDINTSDPENATSYANFEFVADGILKQVQEEVLSTRVYQIVGATSIDTSTADKRIPALTKPPYTPPPSVPYEFQSCFSPETLIDMSDGTKKMIKDVSIGDKVLGNDGAINTVLGIEDPMLGSRKMYGFNGMEPFVSEEHPLMTTEGWGAFNGDTLALTEPDVYESIVDEQGEILELKENSMLVTTKGAFKIENIVEDAKDPEYKIYNLLLDGNHTYYANGILAHNKVCGSNPSAPEGACGNPGGGGGGGGGGSCVIATHGVSSGGFTAREKNVAIAWCERNLHDKWYGEIFRRGYRAAGRKKIAEGNAHKYYRDFKDFVDFGRGRNRTFKGATNFAYYSVRLFVTGLFAKKDD